MAEAKVKVIKDERILNEVREIQGEKPETKVWTPKHQMRLVWNLFRTNPKLKFQPMTKEELVGAFRQWDADWENGRLAYPSNTARSLASCEPPLARADVQAEFEVGEVK